MLNREDLVHINGITPNNSIVSLGSTILLLCLPNASIEQKVQVVHDKEILLGDYDGLLGIDFMRNRHAVINYENNNIKINHIVVLFKSELFKSAINYADKIILSPHSETITQLNFTSDIAYGIITNQEIQKDVLIPNILVQNVNQKHQFLFST
ncbi:hypothetical protein HHI36_016984 [Cryptolaemus montrouzieri]|uniref:FHA domain-containing protein n=1 Tax=Cryptolaemus montrouzieri TaxID=559131 RepID=A0ABD2NLG9_9CUCU